MSTTEQSTTLNDIYTPAMFAKEHPQILTEPQVNWLIKTRHKNGLSEIGAVLKISRKIYINKPLFLDWLLKQKV